MLSKRSIFLFGRQTLSLIDFIRKSLSIYRFSYLQEYASLGTGGGIYHFRDLIKSNGSDKDVFFVINGDICADLPLVEMLEFHRSNVGEKGFTILGTEVKINIQFKQMFFEIIFHLRQLKHNRLIMVVLHGIRIHMK